MAKIQVKSNVPSDDDDEDLAALRLAVLQSMGKKQPSQPPPLTAVFKPHFGNPNLISIIPEGAPRDLPLRSPAMQKRNNRPNFFRHPQARLQALKVLPQVQIETKSSTDPVDKTEEEKEEVSTKFSRYEDTESESEDESETEKKESDEESSDESEDVLAIEDDDDSLEALMAQMEHEIETGIDLNSTKKEKKKKSSKPKEKEVKVKADVKPLEMCKPETKTAIVEPTFKDGVKVDNIEFNDKKNLERLSPIAKPSAEIVEEKENCVRKDVNNLQLRNKSKSPLRQISVAPLRVSHTSPRRERQPSLSPPRNVSRITASPKRGRLMSPSPPRNASHYIRAPLSPKRERSRSPLKRKSFSPRRSPILRAHSPPRRKSPRKYSPDRRSPAARSPNSYYTSNKSPSPYYKSREREYVPIRRSRTPIRRKSYSPRNMDHSPKYIKRRSPSPWSPGRRSKSPPRYRSRSPPIHRRSLSPMNRKYIKPKYASPSRVSPKRRSPSLSPAPRSPRRRGFSPRRVSPKRDVKYRRSSLSPKRRRSPQYMRDSPSIISKQRQRSISPRKRAPSVADREVRSKMDRKSRTPSLSLSPSPHRDASEVPRRYTTNSPLWHNKTENTNSQRNRTRREQSPEIKSSNLGDKERKRPTKTSDRDVGKQWDRKVDERRRDRTEKRDKATKMVKEPTRVNNWKEDDDPKEDDSHQKSSKVTDNPIFEARRKKFESKVFVEPASKKICLVNKKSRLNEDKESEEKKVKEEKQVIENSVQTEGELYSGHEEIDEIDHFLNEDVLNLSAEGWSSDDDLFPKVRKKSPEKPVMKPKESSKHHKAEKVSTKEKGSSRKSKVVMSPEKAVTKISNRKKSKARSPKAQKSDMEKERDKSDLRAELSRRREERLTKAGSLHENVPARLLQSAFESALGKKNVKKEAKLGKIKEEVLCKKSVSPPPIKKKERSDGRRVLVLKGQAPVRMQSAHINVTFPKDSASESESSYSSSSDERYTAKRKLPVYMRLGTVQQHKGSGKRKVTRRRQV